MVDASDDIRGVLEIGVSDGIRQICISVDVGDDVDAGGDLARGERYGSGAGGDSSS